MTTDNLNEVIEGAKLAAWLVFELDGRKIADRNSFFDCARANLPMDPPLFSNRSWDAFSDSLWGGIDALPESKILIVWRKANTMASASCSDFEIAKGILLELANSLGCSDDTDGNPKEVCIIVA